MAALRERLTPEQADYVKAVDAFCERECPPHKLRAMTADGTVAHDHTGPRQVGQREGGAACAANSAAIMVQARTCPPGAT